MNSRFFQVLWICAGITFFLRSLPFLFFSKKPMPLWMEKLGQVLPAAIMAVLLVYCLKDINDDWAAIGIPKIAGVLTAAATYIWKHKSWFSIISATGCYLLLLNLL